jgi:two-component system OmpR family sensor kinase
MISVTSMPSMRQPASLRTRLVVSAVVLIAVVAAVIGTVTTVAFRSYQYSQLDRQLVAIAGRAAGPPAANGMPHPGAGAGKGAGTGELPGGGLPGGLPSGNLGVRDPLKVVTGGGAPVGTVGAEVTDSGSIGRALVSTQQNTKDVGPQITDSGLSGAQTSALATVPRDGQPHTVALPARGDYRITYVGGANGTFLVGIPLTQVQNSLNTLVMVEVSVTLAGLIAAGFAGSALVTVALRPLRRVATTATRVSELPLHSGEVAPLVRVPAAEADPRTEVGQVGAALNRMLGHVGSALAARQESEMRVRRFVADAGHELRTPLASIRGYAELTRRGREEQGPDTRHALGRIEAEAERMTGLVEDLLLLARLDVGQPLSHESIDLSPLVVDAVSDAHAAGQDHHWRLELPEPTEPMADPATGRTAGPATGPRCEAAEVAEVAEAATVYGDPSRLQQVLVNLLANARTHTPPGTTVTARVRAEAGPEPRVVLEVQDDGPGIPPALLPHVFERFARGDASRSRAAGSTGLGLAIVRAVVTAHGGTVGVVSEPGRTVFAVRLPAHRAAPPTVSAVTAVAALATVGGARSHSDAQSHSNSQTGHSLSTPL